jgi:hypothetical protein
MKLESKSWVHKTIIGTIVLAILGAGTFGAYMLVGGSGADTQSQTRSKHHASSRKIASTQSMLPAYAKQNDPFASVGGSQGSASAQKSKKVGLAKSKATKGKKIAKNKAAKKHNKKLAKHSKKQKQKFAAAKKHKKQMKTTHKKHKSGHKVAQR